MYASAPGLIDELLIVDNRSVDGSCGAALAAIGETPPIPTRLVVNEENYNLGGSHKVAFQYALERGYSHVVVLHGDDQAELADFLPLMRAGLHREVDALLGSRFMDGALLRGYSRFRRFGNAVFNALFTIVAGRRIDDIGSGLNLFSRTVIAEGDHHGAADDLTFNCYLLLTMAARGRRLRFVPIGWVEEDQVSNARLFRQSKRILGLLLRHLLRDRRGARAVTATAPQRRYSTSLLAERRRPVSSPNEANPDISSQAEGGRGTGAGSKVMVPP